MAPPPFLCWLWSAWFLPWALRPWFFLKYSGSSLLVILDDLVTSDGGRHRGWGALCLLCGDVTPLFRRSDEGCQGAPGRRAPPQDLSDHLAPLHPVP